MRFRNGKLTVDNWKVLMKRTPAMVNDTDNLKILCAFFELRANSQPVVAIEAIHFEPCESKTHIYGSHSRFIP